MMLLRTWRTHLDRLALPLTVVGLAAVGWHNWRQWQRDKAMLAQRMPPEPLPPLENWPRLPKVSALVAAWNEAAYIEQHIQSFLALRYPHKELILCAGGTDDTYQLACRYAGEQVTVLEQQPGEGKQRALRRIFLSASGTIILLTDSDCLLNDASFEALIYPLIQEQTRVTTGAAQPLQVQMQNRLVQYQRLGEHVWLQQRPDQVSGILGQNCALTRETLEAIGGFSHETRTGTDYIISMLLQQSGHPILFVRNSFVQSRYPDQYASYVRRLRRWNKNLIIHGARFGIWSDAQVVLVTALVYSILFGSLILLPIVGLIIIPPSIGLLSLAIGNRLRRMLLGARLLQMSLSPGLLLRVPLYTILDMLGVILAVIDTLHPKPRSQW
jgi:cellulose synthase/poly-beta-1,6-N-acetylglucosamine synthase-like glycosyltransferase